MADDEVGSSLKEVDHHQTIVEALDESIEWEALSELSSSEGEDYPNMTPSLQS